MNDYKTSEHHYLNIILEEIEYSEWYKIKKNEILLLACGRVDEKKISPGRSGGNIVIFFIGLISLNYIVLEGGRQTNALRNGAGVST